MLWVSFSYRVQQIEGFESRSTQTKYYKIGVWCKHVTLRSKIQDLLTNSHVIYPNGATCLHVDSCFIELALSESNIACMLILHRHHLMLILHRHHLMLSLHRHHCLSMHSAYPFSIINLFLWIRYICRLKLLVIPKTCLVIHFNWECSFYSFVVHLLEV